MYSFHPNSGFYTRLNILGEEGADSGSLRTELWRLVARNAQGFLVCGNHGRCIHIHSVTHPSVRNHVLLTAIVNRSMLLKQENFKKFEVLIAMAIVQDCMGCPVFAPCVYSYLFGKKTN